MTRCRLVHYGSREFTQAGIVVVGFIRDNLREFTRAHLGVVGFIRVRVGSLQRV